MQSIGLDFISAIGAGSWGGGGLYFEQHNFFKDQREILQNPSGKRLVGYSVVQGSIK